MVDLSLHRELPLEVHVRALEVWRFFVRQLAADCVSRGSPCMHRVLSQRVRRTGLGDLNPSSQR